MVEKLLLLLCYTVIQLSFKGSQKLVGGGGGRRQLPLSFPLCPPLAQSINEEHSSQGFRKINKANSTADTRTYEILFHDLSH